METLETLNYRLKRDYGVFDGNNAVPLWRVVWSEDQFELRKVDRTKEGLQLLHPVVEERPKYKQWIHNKYVLERCLPILPFVETDLVAKYSYEPVWVFEDNQGNPLPPKWEPIVLIIDSVYGAAARSVGAKYKDPDAGDDAAEIREQRLKRLEEELFGNETSVGDALAHKEAIVVPKGIES